MNLWLGMGILAAVVAWILLDGWFEDRRWQRDERWAAERLRLDRNGPRLAVFDDADLDEIDTAFFEDWFALPCAPDPVWKIA